MTAVWVRSSPERIQLRPRRAPYGDAALTARVWTLPVRLEVETAAVLDVLCSEMELGEYGEALSVGDVVRRLGVRRRSDWFGTGLDRIEYRFDRYAGLVGSGEVVMLAGEIDAIAALYTKVTLSPDGTWGPRAGSASIEPLTSTRDTRRPLRRIAWTLARPGERASGRPELQEGDESLWGWRVTLADAALEAVADVS